MDSVGIITQSALVTTGGYACGYCGQWTNHGATHMCQNALGPYYYQPTYTTIESGRLTELMEAERKLSEIKRIIGG